MIAGATLHLRCDTDRLKDVKTKNDFAAVVEDLKPLWRAETNRLRALYRLDQTL